jgi:hypothetical protein
MYGGPPEHILMIGSLLLPVYISLLSQSNNNNNYRYDATCDVVFTVKDIFPQRQSSKGSQEDNIVRSLPCLLIEAIEGQDERRPRCLPPEKQFFQRFLNTRASDGTWAGRRCSPFVFVLTPSSLLLPGRDICRDRRALTHPNAKPPVGW